MDDNKKSTTIWLRPSVISRMDGWLEADNCQSRSEFVDNVSYNNNYGLRRGSQPRLFPSQSRSC